MNSPAPGVSEAKKKQIFYPFLLLNQ